MLQTVFLLLLNSQYLFLQFSSSLFSLLSNHIFSSTEHYFIFLSIYSSVYETTKSSNEFSAPPQPPNFLLHTWSAIIKFSLVRRQVGRQLIKSSQTGEIYIFIDSSTFFVSRNTSFFLIAGTCLVF